MRPTLALFGCLAVSMGPLLALPLGPADAEPRGAVRADDAAALRQQVAAQAAEIAQLKRQVAAQVVEIERLKHPAATPSSSPAPATPPTVTTPTPTASAAIYDFVLSGSYPLAVGAADNSLARNPDDIEVVALKAYALAAFGSIDGARPLIVKALRATDGKTGRARALTLVAQGVVAAADEDTRAAAAAFQSAGNADPALGLAYIAYASLLHKVGKDEMAHSLLKAALQEKLTEAEATAVKQKLATL